MDSLATPIRSVIALLAAPAAWIVQGLAGWLVGSRTCAPASIAVVRAIVAGVGIGALTVAVASFFLGVNNWRALRPADRMREDRSVFLAYGGVFVSGVFTIAIAWAAITALFVNVCGAMR
jgi:hypothetical protein